MFECEWSTDRFNIIKKKQKIMKSFIYVFIISLKVLYLKV